ncbi:MAG: hypothetical protein ACHQJ6_03260 [Candidatus Berkiellales bacterium]
MLGIFGSVTKTVKNFWNNNLWDKPQDAPPFVRYYPPSGYAPLARVDEKGKETFVGSFMPERFILAKAKQLPCQIELANWRHTHPELEAMLGAGEAFEMLQRERPDLAEANFHPDGTPKSTFEVSLIPFENLSGVQWYASKDHRYLHEHQLPLPPFVSKYRFEDYLPFDKDLFVILKNDQQNDEKKSKRKKKSNDVRLKLMRFPDGCSLNVRNESEVMTTREKRLHYVARKFALLKTISEACAGAVVVAALMGSPIIGGILGFTLYYYAKKTSNDFGQFDVAEVIHRYFGVLTSKKLGWKGKFDWRSALNMTLAVAAASLMVFFAAPEAFASVMAWSLWSGLSGLGVPGLAVAATQSAMATFFAGATTAAVYVNLFSILFFWGLTGFDNRIQICKKGVERLPEVSLEPIDRFTYMKEYKVRKTEDLSPEDRQALLEMMDANAQEELRFWNTHRLAAVEEKNSSTEVPPPKPAASASAEEEDAPLPEAVDDEAPIARRRSTRRASAARA